MGANLGTAPAVDTPFRIKLQRCISIGIKHQINPIKRLAPRRIPMAIPDPAISAMTGTYRKISFFTPVLEVLVVEPVKFRARYAVTAGMIRSGAVTASIFAQKGSTGSVENETATVSTGVNLLFGSYVDWQMNTFRYYPDATAGTYRTVRLTKKSIVNRREKSPISSKRYTIVIECMEE